METRILIIQTAFIGDVILATPLIEKLKRHYPEAKIDFLLRKGNEGLLLAHPHLNEIIVWNKKHKKYRQLFRIIKRIRQQKYDKVINLQRFAATGIITLFSGAKEKSGFDKNPFSFCYNRNVKHETDNEKHETERNLELISHCTDSELEKPKLYPSLEDFDRVKKFKTGNYKCIAPTSVWFTKQWPAEKWVELIKKMDENHPIYLLGGAEDKAACEEIKAQCGSGVVNLSGQLSFLESAALIGDATMTYVNDSAPLHMASAMNAPVRVVYCSTVPDFGFGPLSDNSEIIETKESLSCRPCGLHGQQSCPEGHFKCAVTININQVNG